MIPLLELFSSKRGTFQFQRRNFSVPREELFDSSGGKGEIVRTYDFILPKFYLIAPKFHFSHRSK